MHKLLIADDESALRMLVAATLGSEEFEIIEAENGVEALERAGSACPDLALVDVNMPEMDGLEVCRRARATPALAGMKIVMLTAAASPGDVALGLAAGADLYLTKPFSPLQLLEVVDEAVREA